MKVNLLEVGLMTGWQYPEHTWQQDGEPAHGQRTQRGILRSAHQLINTPLDTLSYSSAFSPFFLIVLTLLYTRGLEIHAVVLYVMAP
jgi:hypothetical protein